MISPSQAAIEADASLAVHSSSHVKHGLTTDGLEWVASYAGDRASFRVASFARCDLLTHEQADTLAAIAPYRNSFELAMVMRRGL